MCLGHPAVQYRQAVQGIRCIPRKISWTFSTAASSASFRGWKSFMKERLSSIWARSLMPERTIIIPGNPAAKRMAQLAGLPP